MTKLVDFDETQNRNNVHEGGIKLEVFIRWAYMVACTENSFKDQSPTHCKEYTILLMNSKILLQSKSLFEFLRLLVLLCCHSSAIHLFNSSRGLIIQLLLLGRSSKELESHFLHYRKFLITSRPSLPLLEFEQQRGISTSPIYWYKVKSFTIKTFWTIIDYLKQKYYSFLKCL